jgi:hypothetical protein
MDKSMQGQQGPEKFRSVKIGEIAVNHDRN